MPMELGTVVATHDEYQVGETSLRGPGEHTFPFNAIASGEAAANSDESAPVFTSKSIQDWTIAIRVVSRGADSCSP